MTRRILSGTLVVATHNPGKLWEFQQLLEPFDLKLVSAGDLGLIEPEETGTTYSENARLKAEVAAKGSGLPALADDSGLAVEALWGAPGIYSARWAGPDRDFSLAMARVQAEMEVRGATTPERRRAAFVAALCLMWPDGEAVEVEGAVCGTAVWPPVGTLGFGYDPMFLPAGESRTFGEMMSAEKHRIDWTGGRGRGLSHRARAFIALAERCLPAPGTTASAR